ncbi:hypothetical protein EX30DRAFT_373402 [Ascodesmis nigricans]|uniref:Uncharacterized protein n=1 Tax=Ascodesmis nigricans TaxID=341454 RepID=A0A4S2MRY6_9PEZI|nr:hypothetical protein EX30DRAFT_373402 [Ascodesmis nigricans]
MKKIKRAENEKCWWCGAPRQNRGHLFKECSNRRRQQEKLWKNLGEEGLTKTHALSSIFAELRATAAILEFLESTDVVKLYNEEERKRQEEERFEQWGWGETDEQEAEKRPPERLTSLFDHTFGSSGVPSIALAQKKAAGGTRLRSSLRAVSIATPTHQTASTITTDTAQSPINNALPVEQNHQDERKNERARKRPHSAGDLVEDCSIAELQKLVVKAIQKAMTP